MTEEQLCNLVLEATGKSEKELPKTRIIGLSSLALQKLADVIAEVKDRPDAQAIRQLIRVDNTVTITAGVGSLVALKNQAEPILADELFNAELYLGGVARRAQALPDRAALALDRPQGFPFFAIAGDEIFVKYNGLDFTGTLTIRGPVIPTLAHVPQQLETTFASIVASLANGGMHQLEQEAMA